MSTRHNKDPMFPAWFILGASAFLIWAIAATLTSPKAEANEILEMHQGKVVSADCVKVAEEASTGGAVVGGTAGAVGGAVVGEMIFGKTGGWLGGLVGGAAGGAVGSKAMGRSTYQCTTMVNIGDRNLLIDIVTNSLLTEGQSVTVAKTNDGWMKVK